jgi:hypothetical protein
MNHGEVSPNIPARVEAPPLPLILRESLILNLPHEEAVDRYGLWKVSILERCSVHGQILEAGDEAELTGDVVQTLVLQGKATVADKRMRDEAEIINKAAALGLPQKLREIAAFAPKKRDKFDVRFREEARAD